MKTSVACSVLIFSLLGLTVLTGLPRDGIAQGSSQGNPPIKHQQNKVYIPTGVEGTITGTIDFIGDAPKRTKIDMYADPVCVKLNSERLSEDVLVSNGKLANVFVYVKSSTVLDLYHFEVPSEPVVLEHKNCRYVPHVIGVQVEQSFRVMNVDPTSHNTNASVLFTKQSHNAFQAPGGPALEWTFTMPELFIPIKCNQHPWEKAYIGVFSHPFFAVSDDHGMYTIEGLPPGDYTIVAWHEKLGEQTIDISIAPNESRTLNFRFE